MGNFCHYFMYCRKEYQNYQDYQNSDIKTIKIKNFSENNRDGNTAKFNFDNLNNFNNQSINTLTQEDEEEITIKSEQIDNIEIIIDKNKLEILMTKCATDYNKKDFDLICEMTNSHTMDLCRHDILELFWQNNYEHILNYCKKNPSQILKFNVDTLNDNLKNQVLNTFAIKIFNDYPEDSFLMCKDNINLITYQLYKKGGKNIRLAKILEKKDHIDIQSMKLINKNAYIALSKQKYGISYLLFTLIDDKKALRQIYQNNIPKYLKYILNFSNDFE